MGEYATLISSGAEIKIGTCEDLYYLRADQARYVSGGDIAGRDWTPYRFRFPFPAEDNVQPGAFEDYDYGWPVWGMAAPRDVDHYSVQFVNQAIGYNLSIPCPEGHGTESGLRTVVDGLTVHRNGFRGATRLVQQRPWEGQLVPVCDCVCGARYRLPTLADATELLDCLLKMGDRERESIVGEPPAGYRAAAHEIAIRVRRGFDREYVASLGL